MKSVTRALAARGSLRPGAGGYRIGRPRRFGPRGRPSHGQPAEVMAPESGGDGDFTGIDLKRMLVAELYRSIVWGLIAAQCAELPTTATAVSGADGQDVG